MLRLCFQYYLSADKITTEQVIYVKLICSPVFCTTLYISELQFMNSWFMAFYTLSGCTSSKCLWERCWRGADWSHVFCVIAVCVNLCVVYFAACIETILPVELLMFVQLLPAFLSCCWVETLHKWSHTENINVEMLGGKSGHGKFFIANFMLGLQQFLLHFYGPSSVFGDLLLSKSCKRLWEICNCLMVMC